MKIFGGILAGGTGSRMESASLPKQFLRIGGIPVFIRTLRTFESFPVFEKIIISINADWDNMYRLLLEEYGLTCDRIILVRGGATRFSSLTNVVKKAAEISRDECAYIVTHDAARIFVTERIIQENIENVQQFDMVTTSIPTIDTMLESEDGTSCKVLDRTKLWNDQGPQTFEVHRFLEYENKIPIDELSQYIEAGRLFLENSCKVGIVHGDRLNFKITNDIDVKYAEFLIREGFLNR